MTDTSKVSDDQLHVMRHALGLDDYGRGEAYRNYYYVYSLDPALEWLVGAGLMTRENASEITRPAWIYRVTDAGWREVSRRRGDPIVREA